MGPGSKNVTLIYAGAVSGQRVSARFPRPSQNAVPSAVPLQGWCTLPLRPYGFITYRQGIAAKASGHATFPKSGHVHLTLSIQHNGRHNTPPLLHCAARPALQRTPSLPFHVRRASRFKTACLGSLGNRPRFARRARHSGTSVFRLPLHYGRSPRPRLWATSLHSAPVCILQPTEPVPPTACVLETVCGGPAALAESLTVPLRHLPDEIRIR